MARELDAIRRPGVTHVVEMLGDLGTPLLQHEAGRATLQLARALGAEPVLLRTPGVLATAALREAVLRDAHVGRALSMLDELDLAFVGVGPADFHGPLREGDNFFSAEQLADVRAAGAVGQLDQRFIDADGEPGHHAARRPRRRHHARPAARGAAPASSSRAAPANGSPCTPRCAVDGSTCSSPTSPAPAT